MVSMSARSVRMLGVGLLVLTPFWLALVVRADAVVYCARPGVPAGCVVRPVARVGVGAPGVGVAPRGVAAPGGVGGAPGVGLGAPGAGVAPANRGGPVNRAGIR
jgi:hypothetical protein